MNVEKLLDDEIRNEFEGLNDMELGTDEYKTTVDGLTKMIDRTIELKKIEIESDERARNREVDIDLKLKQMEEERKERLVRNSITVAGIVVPSAITIWGTLKSFKFEETGTITTMLGRGFINKLLPKK